METRGLLGSESLTAFLEWIAERHHFLRNWRKSLASKNEVCSKMTTLDLNLNHICIIRIRFIEQTQVIALLLKLSFKISAKNRESFLAETWSMSCWLRVISTTECLLQQSCGNCCSKTWLFVFSQRKTKTTMRQFGGCYWIDAEFKMHNYSQVRSTKKSSKLVD